MRRPTLITLRTCSQGAGAMRDSVLAIMNMPKEKLRVITEDVGGAFGLKTVGLSGISSRCWSAAQEDSAGRCIGCRRRSEAFLTDNQARDIYSEAELALDEKGKFLALRIRNVGNLGAYVGAVGANIPTLNFTRCLPGMYDIKHIDVARKCAFTNTMPTAPYRGAGRPEASYVLERVVDEAARITGIDPVKLRRRNLIKKSAMPYKTAVGTTYRLRRFRADPRQGAGAGRLRRLQEAPARSAEARQISRFRHLLHARTFRRRADRKRTS